MSYLMCCALVHLHVCVILCVLGVHAHVCMCVPQCYTHTYVWNVHSCMHGVSLWNAAVGSLGMQSSVTCGLSAMHIQCTSINEVSVLITLPGTSSYIGCPCTSLHCAHTHTHTHTHTHVCVCECECECM